MRKRETVVSFNHWTMQTWLSTCVFTTHYIVFCSTLQHWAWKGSKNRYPITVSGMSIAKSASVATLKSARWSTNELSEGLAHLLVDMQGELPDDLALLSET